MARPSLTPQMIAQITGYIIEKDLPVGHHLASQVLADEFRVSRAPIAAALKAMEEMRIVRAEPHRGYFLNKSGKELQNSHALDSMHVEDEDEFYFSIAEDRLNGKLSERISEAELMRLYQLPRSRILKLLHRIAEEGWIERLAGNGWEFKPVLTSRTSYEQSYQFRAALESQALLIPTFKIDKHEFARLRDEQTAILEGGYKRMSRDYLFRTNSEFHEVIASWSQNDFFVDALKRVNRLRRLVEYKVTVDRSRFPLQCEEHLRILKLLEQGDRSAASDFLRVHILGASAIKTPQLA
jgi:DNA-binding GntR family transcriptional regulator